MGLNCNINKTWDTFHYSAMIFYFAYGLLCCFAYRPYCKYIYFRGRWDINNNNWHSNDKILEYMTIGAGECCIHMTIMNLFGYIFANPEKISSNLKEYLEGYLIVQICTWIKWTLTEAYYTYTKIEWVPIGILHIFLCLCVLAMSITNYIEVKDNCL